MFDWEYLNKHPWTAMLMLLLTALIIFVVAYAVKDYYTHRKDFDARLITGSPEQYTSFNRDEDRHNSAEQPM